MKPLKDRLLSFYRQLLKEGWRTTPNRLSPVSAFWLRQCRLMVIVMREFKRHQCYLRASALTLYTILSIVPVLALAFGIAGGFGLKQRLERELLNNFPGQAEIVGKAIGYANSLLKNTQGELIAGVGVLVLIWTVIKVLGNIESSLNVIWDTRSSRSLGRKMSDYLSMMIMAPVLIILSGSVTVFIRTRVIMITERIDMLDAVSPLILFPLKFVPFLIIWFLFTMIYFLMPNTTVRFVPALTAGVIAGTMYQLSQYVYIYFQIGVARNNAIYGSFAALPLFIIWLQASWVIALFGAVMSAVHQRADQFVCDPDCRSLSPSLQKTLAVQLVHTIIRRFCDGAPPIGDDRIRKETGLPKPVVQAAVAPLLKAGILSAVLTETGETAYQPAQDPDRITLETVLRAFDKMGHSQLSDAALPSVDDARKAVEAFWEAAKKSPANRRIKDL